MWETSSGTPIQLTHDGVISQPALTADGLVYVVRSRNASDLWLVPSEGPPRAITRNTAATPLLSHWASQPVFIPDRGGLYAIGDFNKASTGAGDLAVWELSLSRDPPVQITHPPAYAGGDQDVTVNPEDPRQIIFTRYAYAGTQLVEQLQSLDVSSNVLVALTPPDRSARQASYSPDAKEVAFVQDGPDALEALYLADLRTSGRRAQLEEPRSVASGVIANPVWTADGNTLGYLALTSNGFQLFSVDIRRDGNGAETFGEPHQITTGPALDATSRPVFLSSPRADDVRRWLGP